MTTFACIYSFNLEAADAAQRDEYLAAWRSRVEAASPKLGIGFTPGWIASQPLPVIETERTPIAIADPETLFDDPL